ncbi:glycoside hydrolase family 27 protein [Asticcacaulis sp. EMRT-3]|uniref:glycoside hydrolase family 27 protein n=1 Tax=Asticcacaulis sp. EMRT-3 TaxID=3040349 RepID=UPI0024AEABBC|nr:glycoside hydrolase family 27 protein [Asticcacaulis sp. EMRT-3]MDI7775811.1 glycoside hydrolase family 27 protein [Asticcacaulis sp. EMRT-3]
MKILRGLALFLVVGLPLTGWSGTALAQHTTEYAQLLPKPEVAMTPPMGWNSWNHFQCNIDEAKIRGAADAMAASGMKDAGYQYVIIDDCWQVGRDAQGNIVADPVKFPSGIKALADYIHSKGLKFGIYSDAGTKTCGGRPGSRGHEFQDAKQYAAWGVDYLKYDWCYTGSDDARANYAIMATALRESGRDIVFSICEWGTHKPWEWAAADGHLWRTTGDITDAFYRGHHKGWDNGVLDILDEQVGLEKYAGPNHWNDPDMLEVGNGGMTDNEYRAHFSLWAMLAAPLIAGNDLSNMSEATKTILLNKDVIAVDQDTLGREGHRVSKDGDFEVWARPLSNGDTAVILLNRSAAMHRMTADWKALGLTNKADVKDLWSKAVKKNVQTGYTADVPSHAVVMIRVTPRP